MKNLEKDYSAKPVCPSSSQIDLHRKWVAKKES